jgi:hypothetical protein
LTSCRLERVDGVQHLIAERLSNWNNLLEGITSHSLSAIGQFERLLLAAELRASGDWSGPVAAGGIDAPDMFRSARDRPKPDAPRTFAFVLPCAVQSWP